MGDDDNQLDLLAALGGAPVKKEAAPEPAAEPAPAPEPAPEPEPEPEPEPQVVPEVVPSPGPVSAVAAPVSPGALSSRSHPMRVGWMPLPEGTDGALGLAFVPGRRDVSRYTGARWERDLALDLAHLQTAHGVTHLVIAHGANELAAIGVPDLVARAEQAGLTVWDIALEDEGEPARADADALCAKIVRALAGGAKVVVVSRGGQGRTGLLVGAVLVTLGLPVATALDHLRELRGPHCPHPEGVAYLGGEPKAEAVAEADPDLEADPDPDPEPEADPDPEADLDPDPDPDPDLDPDDEDEDEDDWDDEDEDEDEDDDWDDEDEDEDDLDDSFDPDELDAPAVGAPLDDDPDDDDAFGVPPLRRQGEGGGHLLDASVGEVSGTFDLAAPPDAVPPVDQLVRDPRRSRNVGAVLAAAIGDAIGHPTEFVGSFEGIREKWPPNGVTGFELWWDRGGQRFAPYTDDTQMAEVVLRALLWARRHDADLDRAMRKMAEGFVAWASHPQGGHRAPGNACLAGCRALANGADWRTAGGATAGGCGSVMRAYPFGLVFADDLARAERWSVAHSKLTHRDPIALAASAAMAVGVARTVRGESPLQVCSEMIAAACRYSPRTGAMMARALDEAQDGTPPEVTLKRLEGWAAHEAIAAAVYLFARHPDDPRAAILEGANTPGDSDSLATLAGALCGARVGLGGLPPEWVEHVERSAALVALGYRI